MMRNNRISADISLEKESVVKIDNNRNKFSWRNKKNLLELLQYLQWNDFMKNLKTPGENRASLTKQKKIEKMNT